MFEGLKTQNNKNEKTGENRQESAMTTIVSDALNQHQDIIDRYAVVSQSNADRQGRGIDPMVYERKTLYSDGENTKDTVERVDENDLDKEEKQDALDSLQRTIERMSDAERELYEKASRLQEKYAPILSAEDTLDLRNSKKHGIYKDVQERQEERRGDDDFRTPGLKK